MDEYRENVKKVQKALNQDAAFIQPNPYLAQRVLSAAYTEGAGDGGSGVRKKFSLGFVLVFVLMMLTVTAVAAVFLSGYWENFAANESAYGAYDDWPVYARVEMVRMMADNERPLNESKVSQLITDAELSDDQRGKLADEILQEYFGGHPFLSTTQVMEHELGSFGGWSVEQKAFYTALMQEYGLQGQDWPVYYLPEEDDLSIAEVQAIAQSALKERFELNDFNSYDTNVSFANWPEHSEYGDQTVWDVFFRHADSPAEYYRVIMTRTGEILALESPGAPALDWNESRIAGAILAEPQACDISREKAIMAARKVMTEVIQYDQVQVEMWNAQTSFFYHPDYCRGWEPVWLVTFAAESGEGVYQVLLGYDGLYIDAVPAGKEFSYTVARRMYIHDQLFPGGIRNAAGEDFGKWSHEERAQFSARYKALVDEYLAVNPYYKNFGSTLYELTRCVYGVPEDQSIAESEAVSIAKEKVFEMGAARAGFDSRSVVVYYDVTDGEAHRWRVYFTLAKEQVDDSYKNHYMVEINAGSGNIEQARILIRGEDSFYPYY